MTGRSELEAETVVPQGTTITLQMYPKAEVDALIAEKDEEIHRLRRALYRACANWARAEREPLENWGCYKEAQRWSEVTYKCRAMAEEYR